MHIETLSAAKYYGPHATGKVVLVNGHPALHDSARECRIFEKRLRERQSS